jgi:hypothetical protein
MSSLFSDTAPAAEAVPIELMRRAPAWRKLQIMDQLNQSLRLWALSGLRQRYRGASEAELRRLADLVLGPELAARVYEPRPEENHFAG